MGWLSNLFGGSQETWEPSEETVTDYDVDDDGNVTELTLLSQNDGMDFLRWASTHREEAYRMLGGEEPEPEEEQPRSWWRLW